MPREPTTLHHSFKKREGVHGLWASAGLCRGCAVLGLLSHPRGLCFLPTKLCEGGNRGTFLLLFARSSVQGAHSQFP